jgi:hypothetical protein
MLNRAPLQTDCREYARPAPRDEVDNQREQRLIQSIDAHDANAANLY